ncbi:MAG: hypothetical protein WA017_02435 [Desulfosalsimonadaceae bacterium]
MGKNVPDYFTPCKKTEYKILGNIEDKILMTDIDFIGYNSIRETGLEFMSD